MESVLIYLFKAAALTGIFFLCYILVLKRDTSFELHRKFLISGLFLSAILPGIYFTKKVYVEATPVPVNLDNLQQVPMPNAMPLEAPTDWWQIAGIIYLIITGFFLLRFFIQLLSVFRIIISSGIESDSEFRYIKIEKDQLPFSFFNYIVYNPEIHSEKDLKLILQHEKVHASQFHSLDILIINFVQCLLWFNPLIWFYKRAIEQNLEFIADKETVQDSAEIKDYQHALVKVSIANLKPALTNHFYQSFIKKRILMLNQRSTKNSSPWKLGIIMPFLLAFMLLWNVKTEAHIVQTENDQTSVLHQETGVSVTITPTTTPESLEKLKKFLEERNIEVSFDNLKFENGKITSIDFSFVDKQTGNNGNMTRSNSDGIKSFKFYRNEEGIGFKDVEATSEMTSHGYAHSINSAHLNKLEENPLYIIKGEKYRSKKLKNKHIKYSSGVKTLNGEEATNLYGDEASNGAIIIPDGEIVKNFKKELGSLKTGGQSFDRNFIKVGENGKPVFLSIRASDSPMNTQSFKPVKDREKLLIIDSDMGAKRVFTKDSNHAAYGYRIKKDVEDPETIHVLKAQKLIGYSEIERNKNKQRAERIHIMMDSTEGPIYIINGEIKGRSLNSNAISPSEIKNIRVYKGDSAITKYGDKARFGAIEINTKAINVSKDALIKIHAGMTNEELEAAKKELNEKTGMNMELENVSRNDGQITEIRISNNRNGKQVSSAQFSGTDGIPNIYVGIKNGNPIITSSKD